MKNFKKILISTLTLSILFLSINIVKADTFNFFYSDPTLKSPAGCGITGGLLDPDGNPKPCTDNGDREIQGTLNLSPAWNETSQIISLNLSISYQICKDSFCIDGNDPSVYGGNSYLNLSSGLVTGTTLQVISASKNFPEYSCLSNCFGPSLKSSDSFSWSIKLGSDFLPLEGDYGLENTFSLSLITPENAFNFPIAYNSIISITNPCSITEQQVIDNYYNSVGDDYQEKIYSPWETYHEYYNNVNTLSVGGINEMLYGDPIPDFPGSDGGTLRGGGDMCVEESVIPSGYLLDFGDCTPSIPEICSTVPVKATLKLK